MRRMGGCSCPGGELALGDTIVRLMSDSPDGFAAWERRSRAPLGAGFEEEEDEDGDLADDDDGSL